jgi:hypothetical protein
MADFERTRVDRFLDAVHDYMPLRVQGWIEERAFTKQINANYVASATATPDTAEWDKIVNSAIEEQQRGQREMNALAATWERERPDETATKDFANLTDAAKQGIADARRELLSDNRDYAKESADLWKAHPYEDMSPTGKPIDIIHEGKWQMDADGRVESKTSIGKSEDGFHYKTSSTDNHTFDSEGSWSKGFKTQDLAEHVAMAMASVDDGGWMLSDRRRAGIEAKSMSPRQVGPKAQIAESLNHAAENRRSAAWLSGRDEGVYRNAAVERARQNVGNARGIRVAAQTYQRDMADIKAHFGAPKQDRAQGIER